MSTVAHPASEHPRLRIRRLMRMLAERHVSAREFLDAAEHTAAESERIAYILDARLVLHPGTVPASVLAEQRQAALLRAVTEQGGRWKSGRACRLYRSLGYGQLAKSTGSHDLKALRAAGHLIQHDVEGVRYFTLDGGSNA